jgi:hypothetical protein
VSLSRTTFLGDCERVNREIIRPISAWDQQTCSQVALSAGIVVSGCQIVPGVNPGDEPYRVEFQSSGRSYRCALHSFLPRTRSIAAVEAQG